MSTAFNKPTSELRTTIKSGIKAGFYPSVVGFAGGESGIHTLGGNLSWNEADGLVNVIGFNYHQQPNFEARHPIRSKRTWYSRAHMLLRHLGKKEFDEAIESEAFASAWNSVEGFKNMMKSGAMGGAPVSSMLQENFWGNQDYPTATGRNNDYNAQVRVLKDIHNEFKRNSAAYTGQYLREINTQISNRITSIGGRDADSGRELRLRKGAHPSQWASEEQTAILVDQASHKDGIEALESHRDTIGLTQPVDAYIKIGNKIIAIDVTESKATADGEKWTNHHSLTGGPIWQRTEDIPKSRDKIIEDMKNYYNNEITSKWNPHLGTIKRMAAEAHGVSERDLTAEHMRAPTGFGGPGTQHDVADRSGGRIQRMRGGGASITVRRLAGMSKREADRLARGGASAGKMTNSVAKHLMHSIGNWSNTVNGLWDTFTLTHTPAHVTAGVLLRQYRSGARKFLYKKLKDKHVKVFDGPATHGLLQELGGTLHKSSALIMNDQMSGHLVRKALGKMQPIANVGGFTIQTATSQGARGFSAGIYVPEASLDARMAHVVNVMLDRVANGSSGALHAGLQNYQRNAPGGSTNQFIRHLNQFKERRASQLSGGNVQPGYSFWAMPYYGIEEITIEPEVD